MASSEKLKELQLQIQSDAEALHQEISAKETHLTGGASEIAHDPQEATDNERRSLLRKQQAQQTRSRVPYKKITIIIATTAAVSVLILLLFFGHGPSRDTMQQDIQTEEQEAETYVLDDAGCPPLHAIPEYCRGKTRLKNVSVFDTCKELFDKHGWDPAALRACKLIE